MYINKPKKIYESLLLLLSFGVATILRKQNSRTIFKDFQKVSSTFSRLSPATFYHAMIEYLMFVTSYKISSINRSYTEGNGSVESLLPYKVLYTVQSIELEISKMTNLKYTRFWSIFGDRCIY